MSHSRNDRIQLFGQSNLLQVFVCVMVGCLMGLSVRAQSNDLASVDLTMKDYLQQVVNYNQTLQAQMLDAQAQTYKLKSEKGIFEPDFEASYTYQFDDRWNNTQQAAEQGASRVFEDRNIIYDGGVEELIPTGAKIRLGVTMSDLYNNISPGAGISGIGFNNGTNFYRQIQTFAGVNVTQPLLKNAWFTPVMVNIRLAALDSEISFQEYRRQLMLTMYQAEGAYWNLYFAQEQIQFFDDSVAAAHEVLDDSQAKLKAGQGAELDVMEAQSALALRNTKRNDAVQSYYEALGHLQVLAGVSPNPDRPASGSPMFRAADDPHTSNSPPTYAETYEEGFALNPDYLIQQYKMNQERLRVGVAKNQILPELDAKADYGYNGLGLTPGQSWDQLGSEAYPSWDAGIQLTIPLGGNIKGRNDLKGARLHLQEAYINLKGVETEMANSLSTSVQKRARGRKASRVTRRWWIMTNRCSKHNWRGSRRGPRMRRPCSMPRRIGWTHGRTWRARYRNITKRCWTLNWPTARFSKTTTWKSPARNCASRRRTCSSTTRVMRSKTSRRRRMNFSRRCQLLPPTPPIKRHVANQILLSAAIDPPALPGEYFRARPSRDPGDGNHRAPQ